MDDYSGFDGLGLAELVRKREATSLHLVDAAIARIERHNPALNAVVHKAYDEARAAAESPLPDCPFRGVPFLIKDLGVKVKGWPRTSGSRFAEIAADGDDSELVRRHRASGVVLVGKTNTPEFGIPGVTTSARLGPAAIPGAPIISPAAPPAARRPQWLRAWSRSRTPATAWARSAFRRRSAGWLA